MMIRNPASRPLVRPGQFDSGLPISASNPEVDALVPRAKRVAMKAVLSATVLCLLVAACASSPPIVPAGSSKPAASQPTGWRAVLVAGDDAEPAFDNAVDAMARKLGEVGVPRADIAILKANGRGDEEATTSNIVAAFAGLTPGPSE